MHRNPTPYKLSFDDLKNELNISYPQLLLIDEANSYKIIGPLDIRTKNKILTSYTVEIEVPVTFPKKIPRVREISGKIPKIADRHMFANGHMCLFLEDESWKYVHKNSTISKFIKDVVEPFLFWQSYYDIHGKEPFSGRSHGAEGVYEYYYEVLKSEDKYLICKFLEHLSLKHLKSHYQCFCGSGKQIRNCHINLLKDNRSKTSKKIARKSLKIARDDLKKSLKTICH